eukprot:4492241-Karenia_brevis.AAC.1
MQSQRYGYKALDSTEAWGKLRSGRASCKSYGYGNKALGTCDQGGPHASLMGMATKRSETCDQGGPYASSS